MLGESQGHLLFDRAEISVYKCLMLSPKTTTHNNRPRASIPPNQATFLAFAKHTMHQESHCQQRRLHQEDYHPQFPGRDLKDLYPSPTQKQREHRDRIAAGYRLEPPPRHHRTPSSGSHMHYAAHDQTTLIPVSSTCLYLVIV